MGGAESSAYRLLAANMEGGWGKKVRQIIRGESSSRGSFVLGLCGRWKRGRGKSASENPGPMRSQRQPRSGRSSVCCEGEKRGGEFTSENPGPIRTWEGLSRRPYPLLAAKREGGRGKKVRQRIRGQSNFRDSFVLAFGSEDRKGGGEGYVRESGPIRSWGPLSPWSISYVCCKGGRGWGRRGQDVGQSEPRVTFVIFENHTAKEER
uniref:Uncharacterized protein LOC110203312 n=1 Tax=Phascolarctos cinereus TaxID=38626 RepID=A0A6P5JVD4_PHACI|nr:uncharacterized protein LOC110203312 [Phascolarctos cinereus]